MKYNFEENMSNYAGEEEHLCRGVDYVEQTEKHRCRQG